MKRPPDGLEGESLLWSNIPDIFDDTTTPESVRIHAETAGAAIIRDWNWLKRIVARHGEALQKRWLAKNRAKRRAALLKAGPYLHRLARPAIHLDDLEGITDVQALVEKVLLPHYMNLEDLVKSEPVLLLFNSRARHPPHTFFLADLATVKVPLASHMLAIHILKKHTMAFAGRTTTPAYGELVEWLDEGCEENARFWVMHDKGLNAGAGLAVLTIQERLYSFLVILATVLLSDLPDMQLHPRVLIGGQRPTLQRLPPGEVPDGPATALPGPLSMSANPNKQGLSSFAVTLMESYYMEPQPPNLRRAMFLASCKLSELEDHLTALREDPAYWAALVLQWKENRHELLLAEDGTVHPRAADSAKNQLFSLVVENVVHGLFLEVEIWAGLYAALRELLKAYEDDPKSHTGSKEGPPESYLRQMYPVVNIGAYLRDFLAENCMATSFFFSPACRHLCRRGRTGHFKVLAPDKCPEEFNKIRFHFSRLNEDKAFRERIGLLGWLDDVERCIDMPPSSRSFLSPIVAGHFSSLCILMECLRQVELIPLGNGHIPRLAQISDWTWSLGNPIDGRFEYPECPELSKETVEMMHRAETRLDDFWNSLKSRMIAKGVMKGYVRVCLDFPIRRTPDWATLAKLQEAPVKADKATGLAGKGKKKSKVKTKEAANGGATAKPDVAEQRASNMPSLGRGEERSEDQSAMSPQLQPPETLDHPQVAMSERKGGDSGQQEQNEKGSPTVARRSTRPPDMMRVDARSMKVLTALFYDPFAAASSTFVKRVSTKVPWQEFVHAMTDIGLVGEKLYGSGWIFAPDNPSPERPSILVHEPVPMGPISMPRIIGRRLEKAFGWNLNCFEVATKREDAAP
ncbi:hypothetical protein VTK73DRAFT_4202 [Phialemonium thermophilum]|uniref:Uncharacterized protein n=1 Tax=Phialemonium thermophilum TaxID=223376 RepID=A0ABR3WUM4_9PEZI